MASSLALHVQRDSSLSPSSCMHPRGFSYLNHRASFSFCLPHLDTATCAGQHSVLLSHPSLFSVLCAARAVNLPFSLPPFPHIQTYTAPFVPRQKVPPSRLRISFRCAYPYSLPPKDDRGNGQKDTLLLLRRRPPPPLCICKQVQRRKRFSLLSIVPELSLITCGSLGPCMRAGEKPPNTSTQLKYRRAKQCQLPP